MKMAANLLQGELIWKLQKFHGKLRKIAAATQILTQIWILDVFAKLRENVSNTIFEKTFDTPRKRGLNML